MNDVRLEDHLDGRAEVPFPSWDANVDGISALPVRLVKPIEWRVVPEKDAVWLWLEATKRDSWLKPRVAELLRGLEAGEGLPALTERLVATGAYPTRERAAANARSLVLGLAAQGNVEIELPPVPEVFADRFERVRELGRGAVGVAWMCRDLEQAGAPPVAIKHAWNWTAPLSYRDANVRFEAELIRRLDHPGIVQFVNGFEVDGRFHLARAYVEGEELGHHTMRTGPPPPAERVQLAHQMASILEHFHERSVLCLDVKPANFMLDERAGTLVFADLGHCRVVDEEPLALERAPGTIGYLAPEIFTDRAATRASDVYAFGKVYEFLTTASPPRQGEDVAGVLERMRRRGATEHDLAFVEACLQPDPAKRPATPVDALDALVE